METNLEIKPDSNTEQSILEAAEKLFFEKGFALTSTTEIARVAGCNQALVHYYFRTKEKLFDAVFEKKARMFVSGLYQAHPANATFEEKIKQKIEAHFDMIRANPKLPFLFFNEMITNQMRLEKFRNSMIDLPLTIILPLKAELEVEIAKGNIRQMSIYDLLITLISLNVMLFLASPVLKILANFSDEEFNKLVEHRKQENVTIILRSLRP
jgi:TetR/AcrR family transcriptional regulator